MTIVSLVRQWAGARVALLTFGLLMTYGANCRASDVVLLEKATGQTVLHRQEEGAASFYGLKTLRYLLGNKEDISVSLNALRQTSTVAAIITSDALAVLDQQQLFSALQRKGSKSIPILVVDITAGTAPELLTKWSAGAVVGCRGVSVTAGQNLYKIGVLRDVTRQLSGQKLTVRSGQTCALILEEKAQPVIALSSGSEEFPTFVRTRIGTKEVFFSAGMNAGKAVPPPNADDGPEYQFSAAAPLLIFLRHAAGDRAWHSNGHYANLTVDDPLLDEPYGNLRYSELLPEMQRHNFHTTVAFIPWNYDRTAPGIRTLFRANSDRFSIAVHGNNHDHQEFPSLQDRSLNLQAANIQQAVARMEKFKNANQLPYDRVMVFPHSIAPEATLGELKRHNFLATANSRNIPLGSAAPHDPYFVLRPMTLAFANFPSVRRYSAEAPISTSDLAIDAFLGNPLLFYIHQEYFAEGINRFNAVADTVNALEDNTIWRGLGEVAQHLYLERQREDSNYDIKAFTSNLQLKNTHPNDAVFVIDKEEDFTFPLRLLVDGEVHAYSRVGNSIRFDLPIRAGSSRQIVIQYQDDINLATVEYSKSSLRVAVLRYLSEFRDNVVSRSSMGREVIRIYTPNEKVINRATAILFMFLIAATVLRLAWRTGKAARLSGNRHKGVNYFY